MVKKVEKWLILDLLPLLSTLVGKAETVDATKKDKLAISFWAKNFFRCLVNLRASLGLPLVSSTEAFQFHFNYLGLPRVP